MAANVDKVEEKAAEDLERALKTSKNRAEAERMLNTEDVSYKIKDRTKEGEEQEYQSNRDIHQ